MAPRRTRSAPALDALRGRVAVDQASAPVWVADRLEAAGRGGGLGARPLRAAEGLQDRGRDRRRAGGAPARRRGAGGVPRLARRHRARGRAERDRRGARGSRRSAPRPARCATSPSTRSAAPGRTARSCTTGSARRATAGSRRASSCWSTSGAQYPDGTTDVTRTVAVGAGAGGGGAAVHPGAEGADRDVAARLARGARGAAHRRGGAGGALAGGARLRPRHRARRRVLSSGCTRGRRACRGAATEPLEPGMIVSIEPGLLPRGRLRHPHREPGGRSAPPEVPEGGERPMLGFETLTLAPDRPAADRRGAARCRTSAPGSTPTTRGSPRRWPRWSSPRPPAGSRAPARRSEGRGRLGQWSRNGGQARAAVTQVESPRFSTRDIISKSLKYRTKKFARSPVVKSSRPQELAVANKSGGAIHWSRRVRRLSARGGQWRSARGTA